MADDVQDVQELGKLALKVFVHAKFLSLSPGGHWLWLRGLMHLTAGNGTLGGVITDAAFKQLGGTAIRAQELTAAGLWRRDRDGWHMRRLNAMVPAVSQTSAKPIVQPVGTEAMRFVIVGGFWVLTKEQIAIWQQTFTGVDVLAECGYAKAWVEAAPDERKKTVRGMPKFLWRWLSQATDRRGARWGGQPPGRTKSGLTGPAPAGRYDGLSKTDDV